MPSLIDGIFWGILLIAVGAWFILRHYLPVRIPVLRLTIAILFIYLGVRVLVRGPEARSVTIFSETHQRYTPGWDRDGVPAERVPSYYNILFGRGDIDLTGVTLGNASVRTQVNVIFGSGVLRFNPALPVRIDMSAAFGAVEAPDGRTVSFGDSVYTTGAYRDGAPALVVHATAVFGRLRVEK